MNQTQQAVCALLKTSLFGGELTLPSEVKWIDVCRELADQTVLALPSDLIGNLDIPAEIRTVWKRKVMQQVYGCMRLLNEQNELVRLFAQQDIPFVVLKGTAAAKYYPCPDYRKMGDVDILVAPEHFDAARKLMSDHGYTAREELKAETRDLPYIKNGVLVELHRRFMSNGDETKGEALEHRIMEAIHRRVSCEVLGTKFPMLPDRENGLVLLEHISQHLEAGLGLRQIVDWLMYVHRALHDDAWPAFRLEAERLGLTELALTVTKMGQMYLGLPTDGISWCSGADESLCAELLAYLFQSGNFGYKDAESSVTINALSRSQDGFFKNLQRCGCRNWKALEKHPRLKPFAWLYQLCRYARLGFARKNPIRSLMADYAKSKKLNRMLRRLGATRHGK